MHACMLSTLRYLYYGGACRGMSRLAEDLPSDLMLARASREREGVMFVEKYAKGSYKFKHAEAREHRVRGRPPLPRPPSGDATNLPALASTSCS